MSKTTFNINNLNVCPQTENFIKFQLGHLWLSYSFNNLFAIEDTSNGKIICKQLTGKYLHTSGMHYNIIQPNHKARITPREFEKRANAIFSQIYAKKDILPIDTKKQCVIVSKSDKKSGRVKITDYTTFKKS